MNKEICIKCDKEAEYDSPAMLCGEHWAEWWAFIGEPTEMTPEEQKLVYEDALKTVNQSRKA